MIGLSPLARGTHQRQPVLSYKRRFIPAGAGNTGVARAEWLTDAVYPRWRGEHIWRSCHRCTFSGLSPLARGTQQRQYTHRIIRRFIPAGAGNTRTAAAVFLRVAVYPRWRGEHYPC